MIGWFQTHHLPKDTDYVKKVYKNKNFFKNDSNIF